MENYTYLQKNLHTVSCITAQEKCQSFSMNVFVSKTTAMFVMMRINMMMCSLTQEAAPS